MIDVLSEHVLSLAHAARHVPKLRGDRRVHISTLYRWVQAGVRGTRLETIWIGGTRCTSIEALQRFFELLSAPRSSSPVCGPHSGSAGTTAADRTCDAAGI